MLKLSNVMTKEVVSILPDAPIMDAARMLIKNKISGMPVADAEGHLMGVISEKDLLRLLTEPYTRNNKVEEYMTRDVVKFKESDSLLDVAEFLIHNNIRRVPIVDHTGKLVGIVSRRNLISEIIRIDEEE